MSHVVRWSFALLFEYVFFVNLYKMPKDWWKAKSIKPSTARVYDLDWTFKLEEVKSGGYIYDLLCRNCQTIMDYDKRIKERETKKLAEKVDKEDIFKQKGK